MQIHFSPSNHMNNSRSSSLRSSSGTTTTTYPRIAASPQQQQQQQQQRRHYTSSLSPEPYQLLQHPMIIQSRSTDSQLDVESFTYALCTSSQASNHPNNMKHKENLDAHIPIVTSNLVHNAKKYNDVAISSFFSRTHPSLLNDSSESSSSSNSVLVECDEKKNSENIRSVTSSLSTNTVNDKKSIRAIVASKLRRRRSQDIFQLQRSTTAVTTKFVVNSTNDGVADSDDDDDTIENGNTIKRTRWNSDLYDTNNNNNNNNNGLWIQRSYAFDESDIDDDDHDEITDSNVNVVAMTNAVFNECPDVIEEPIGR